MVRKADFKALLANHAELSDALLRLNCRRLRLMFNLVEDLNTLPLAARLAKQLLQLARSYGIPEGTEIRIGLQLAQEDLAQLLGLWGSDSDEIPADLNGDGTVNAADLAGLLGAWGPCGGLTPV